jgi:hypothetical protein
VEIPHAPPPLLAASFAPTSIAGPPIVLEPPLGAPHAAVETRPKRTIRTTKRGPPFIRQRAERGEVNASSDGRLTLACVCTLHSEAVSPASAISFDGIDHVQLAAPPGCESEGRRFFGELLGLQELPKPAALAVRGGLWFQCGSQQIHVGIEKDFRAAKKAHPALRLTDEASLQQLKARLQAAGVVTREDSEIEDAARFFADDPWGNRLEFVAARGP